MWDRNGSGRFFRDNEIFVPGFLAVNNEIAGFHAHEQLDTRLRAFEVSSAALQTNWPSFATRKMSKGETMGGALYHKRYGVNVQG